MDVGPEGVAASQLDAEFVAHGGGEYIRATTFARTVVITHPMEASEVATVPYQLHATNKA
ncbi:hypothetical protein GCM10010381_52280 [Streptomyces xantholiticus]|nr:hypothetical protein GCM10010381_52280 [Streptomyces xantholiticus]